VQASIHEAESATAKDALARLSISAPAGSQIKVCSVRVRPCDEACIGSASALR